MPPQLIVLGSLFAVMALLAPAQEVVARASSVDALWFGGDGRLRVQLGRHVFRHAPGRAARLESFDLPADAVMFDDDADGLCVISGTAVRRGETAAPLAASPSPGFGSASSAPLRAALAMGGDRWWVPTRDGLSIFDGRTAKLTASGFMFEHRRTATGGLQGALTDTLVAPFVFPIGSDRLLARVGSGWLVRAPDGTLSPLRTTPLDEYRSFEGFDHVVPPFVANLTGNDSVDLVRLDAEAGVIVVTSGLAGGDDRSLSVTRIDVGGAILAAAPVRKASGTSDFLFVLHGPPLTPAQQVAILVEKRMRARACLYGAVDGALRGRPLAVLDVSVEVGISVHNDMKAASFRTLVAPLDPENLIVAVPGARARRVPMDGSPAAELGVVPEGTWMDTPAPAEARGEVAARLRTRSGVSVVRFTTQR